MKKYRNDIILIGSLLAICFVFFFALMLQKRSDADELQIYGDGALLVSVGTGQDAYILLYREGDGYAWKQFSSVDEALAAAEEVSDYNLMAIEQGEVSVCAADCAGKDCIRQKQICGNGESIICLPHRMLLCLVNTENQAEDAVTW